MKTLRLKFGRNPYTSEFVCAHCRRRFTGGGLYARLEHAGKVVDVPVCARCERKYGLFEGEKQIAQKHGIPELDIEETTLVIPYVAQGIDLGRDEPSHPIGVA